MATQHPVIYFVHVSVCNIFCCFAFLMGLLRLLSACHVYDQLLSCSNAACSLCDGAWSEEKRSSLGCFPPFFPGLANEQSERFLPRSSHVLAFFFFALILCIHSSTTTFHSVCFRFMHSSPAICNILHYRIPDDYIGIMSCIPLLECCIGHKYFGLTC